MWTFIKLPLRNIGLFGKYKNCLLSGDKSIKCFIPNFMVKDAQFSFLQSSCKRKPIALKRYAAEKVLKENQVKKIKATHERLQRKGSLILEDLQKTRNQIKEKVGAIIERENIWTIPNCLCVSRILATPFLGYLIISSNFNLALYILAFAGITDLLDGMIARKFKSQATKLGSFLDPMADKVLMVTMFLSLTYIDLMPVPLTALIVLRDISLAGAGFYIRYMSLPEPRTLTRYFDVSHATAQLSPTVISKLNTLIQLCCAATTLASPVFGFYDHDYLRYLWWLTGISTLISGMSYISSKNTYKLLRDRKKHIKP